jgi:inhibitor of the pro-sigma K processing machinery
LDTNTIIVFIACICFLFLFGRIFIVPVKCILKLVLNSCFGALMIYLINFIGAFWNFHIGLNYVTAIFTGILGVPGVILLLILKLIMGF